MMKKSIGFFVALGLLTTIAVIATTQSNEEIFDGEEVSLEKSAMEIEFTDTLVLGDTDELFKVLSEHDNLSTFSTILRSSALVEKLTSGAAFTLFAPNNAAFNALPKGTVEELLMPENKDSLVSILKNHIFQKKIMSDEIVNDESHASWSGQTTKTSVGSSGIFVNEAKVIKADVHAENGIIHIVDKVLLSE